ncbi:hypothetical protein ACXZ65_01880 [Streptomyces aculeolatus]
MVDDAGGELGAEAARRLVRADCCDLAPGLSAAEIQHVEATYGFEFSADHRAFLMAGLPVAPPARESATWDEPWPDWRNGDPDDLRYRLRWPVEGVAGGRRAGLVGAGVGRPPGGAYVDREFEEEDVDDDAPWVRQQASVDFWKDFLG